MTENTRQEGLEQKIAPRSFKEKATCEIRNYWIDTSAKVAAYAPVMATMEAYIGLDGEQILQSRASAAFVDAFVARIYTKVRDCARRKFNAEKNWLGSYLCDTLSMIGTYTPAYAAILAANGANGKQVVSALCMGAIIAAVSARPFGKYALTPWRKKCGYTSSF